VRKNLFPSEEYNCLLILSGSPFDTGVATYSRYLLDSLKGRRGVLVLFYNISWRDEVVIRDLEAKYIQISHNLFLVLFLISRKLLRLYLDLMILSKFILSKDVCVIFNTASPLAVISVPNKLIPVHDLMHKVYPKLREFKNPLVIKYRDNLYSQLCSDEAVTFLVDSTLGGRHLELFYGFSGKKVVNYFPLPEFEFLKEDNMIKNVYGEYFYYPAAFWEHKNHLFLIRAFKKFLEKYPHFLLVLSGPDRGWFSEVKDFVIEIGLVSNVVFLPYVSELEKLSLIKQSKALVFVSYFGPTNLPPLEAYALQKNSVVVDIFAAREQLGDYPYYFISNDIDSCSKALEEVVVSPGFRRSLSLEDRLSFLKFRQNILYTINK
jgi:glycosyltransferase involved in cell wall biosynthesis